jgi:hypothetical protein
MTEQEKLPPKLDLAEIHQVQRRFDSYFARWAQWEREREGWLIVANRSDAFSELAWLFERGLDLVVMRPDKGEETRKFVRDLVHVPGTDRRRPEWCGDYSEDGAQAARNECRMAENKLRGRFEALGVKW